MAKQGFSYYKAETDRFQDIRIKRLKKAMGCEGYCIYQYILNEVYRVEGAWLQWSDDYAFDAADYWAITEDRVNEIITFCISIKLFDGALFDIHAVLTSREIQGNYVDMCRVSKKKIVLPEEYKLIELESTTMSPSSESSLENSRNISSTLESSGGFAEKTNKEKKRKENKTPSPPLEDEVHKLLSKLSAEDKAATDIPNDGKPRNVAGLMEALRRYALNPQEIEEVLARCGGGEIGHPVWAIIQEIQGSSKIKHPRLFLLSRLRSLTPAAS